MYMTNKLKERFCKDCNISIKIYDEPYFTDRLELYDALYDTLDKWDAYVKELRKYSNEQEYFAEYNRVKDEAINSIKSTDAYQKFNSEDMNKFAVPDIKAPTGNIYKDINNGRAFISIDMRKANFSALHVYDENMFMTGTYAVSCWEQFIGAFTSNEHIINSKYIRQVILGNCNPRRTITYESYLMKTFLKELIKMDSSLEARVVSVAADEVVFDVTDLSLDEQKVLREKFSSSRHFIKVPLNIKLFNLYKIGGTEGFYKQDLLDDSISLHGLNSLNIPFVIRKLNGEKITESDKVFIHEGRLAKFIDIPEIDDNVFKSSSVSNINIERYQLDRIDCNLLFHRLDEIDGDLKDMHVSGYRCKLLTEERDAIKAELIKRGYTV